ncbi:MAG: phosphopentomutase [Vampirovibrionales bacterium]|nr:phosphopentomutase [Vampirovibrionales bacterium]
MPKRVFVLVIDALGAGAMPDAPDYGDALDANTLGHIDAHADHLHLPTLAALGLGHLFPMTQIAPVASPSGAWGRLAERSKGKDTTTGHWEMMGTILETPFPTYPQGFPADIIASFIEKTACGGILGNKPASGTAILDELGEDHLKTGFPIVYTSADSVFQIACHLERIPLETLYRWCDIARDILRGEHEVSRVIARPFEGQPGSFRRIGSKRHDYAVNPPDNTVLNRLEAHGIATIGVGKIGDIFNQKGIALSFPTRDNAHGLELTAAVVRRQSIDEKLSQVQDKPWFVFINLVETDMNYGHRRDVNGYAHALEAIDRSMAQWLPALTEDDLLLITADHGCDPTAPGSDHTREYVPLVVSGGGLSGRNLGDRQTFADIGQTVLDWLEVDGSGLPGQSVLR